MKYPIRYRQTTVYVEGEDPRTHSCVCSHKDNGSFKTHFHHWKHEFPTGEVKKNPELAKKNTVEVCMRHHLLANAIKAVANAKPDDLKILVGTMDSGSLAKLLKVLDYALMK